MKPAAFAYRSADSVQEALSVLGEEGEDAKILAGGQSLIPMLNFRLARPSTLVDVSRVDALRFITRDGERLRVGALTRHRDMELISDPQILDDFGYLPRVAQLVGHYPIRTAGTVGGSLAHADPSAEWCLLALLLDAEIVISSRAGERVANGSAFFTGFFETVLEFDEIVTEVRFPPGWSRVVMHEFARRHGDFALVSAAVAVTLQGRVCTDARVALGGVAPTPVRVAESEQALVGLVLDDEACERVGRLAGGSVTPPSDLHASSGYRRELAAVLVERALREAVGS